MTSKHEGTGGRSAAKPLALCIIIREYIKIKSSSMASVAAISDSLTCLIFLIQFVCRLATEIFALAPGPGWPAWLARFA